MVAEIRAWWRRRGARRRFNPYVVGAPVFDPLLLFGREPLIRHALRLLDTGSLWLTGERRIGKTSFLHGLRRALSRYDGGGRPRSHPVFVDFEAVTAPDLFHALMDETVEALAPEPRVLDGLRFRLAGDPYSSADFRLDLLALLEDLRARTRLPARLVLLIDEVDALRAEPGRGGDRGLVELIQCRPPEVRLVLAGVPPHTAGPGRAALEGLEIGPLTPEAARALVRGPVAGVYRYEAEAVERILGLSDLRPSVIQRLCLDAVDRMLDDRRTTVRPSDVLPAARPAGEPFPASGFLGLSDAD
jgi:hypothetical protein